MVLKVVVTVQGDQNHVSPHHRGPLGSVEGVRKVIDSSRVVDYEQGVRRRYSKSPDQLQDAA